MRADWILIVRSTHLMNCKKALATVSLSTSLGSVETGCSQLDQNMQEPSQQVNNTVISLLIASNLNELPNIYAAKQVTMLQPHMQWLPGCMQKN